LGARESFMKGKWNSEKRRGFSNVKKHSVGKSKRQCFSVVNKGHVCAHDGETSTQKRFVRRATYATRVHELVPWWLFCYDFMHSMM